MKATVSIHKVIIACTLLLTTNATIVVAQEFDSIPAQNQDQFIIHSTMLNEDRTIWVHLPADYSTSDDRFPVIYLLDGGKHFRYVNALVDYMSSFEQPYLSEMIVVAIPNIDRGRDLTPLLTPNNELATDSGAARFLTFIKGELIPYIEKTYRTAPYRILEGHSLGGLFAVFANAKEPTLFQASVIISPALGKSVTARKTLQAFDGSFARAGKRKFFVTLGDENTESVDALKASLKKAPSNKVAWAYRQYPAENHFSVPYKSMGDGLRYFYSKWFINVFLNRENISWRTMDEHFKVLSNEFGYDIHPTEDFLNQAGYEQMRAGNLNEAISLFQENIKAHPNSWNAYDSMGEAYLNAGNTTLAIENYARSVELNPANEAGRQTLKKLKKE